MKQLDFVRWGLSVWTAFVFVQSLFFKFSNSYETQHIFGELGRWSGLPWFGQYGGYGVGGVELVASILLFTSLWGLGALVAFGVMTGAIFFHLFTPLGVVMPAFNDAGKVVGDDAGVLFVMACITCTAALVLTIKEWRMENSRLRVILRQA